MDTLSTAIETIAKIHDARGREIADALNKIATSIERLGVGDAASKMGAIEFLATKVFDGLESLSSEVGSVGVAMTKDSD